MMKRTFNYLITFAIIVVTMVSCFPEEDVFDEALLIGKWKSGTLHYRYDADNTGVSWDTVEDINEEEGQGFSWTLERSELTHIHVIEIGGGVQKTYTVTRLTATTLSYKDDFDTYTFTRVN